MIACECDAIEGDVVGASKRQVRWKRTILGVSHLGRFEDGCWDAVHVTVEHVEHLKSVMLLLDQQPIVAQFQEVHFIIAEQSHTDAAKVGSINDAD